MAQMKHMNPALCPTWAGRCNCTKLRVRSETFEEAWARMEAKGYRYGQDALEQVRFGWKLAKGEIK